MARVIFLSVIFFAIGVFLASWSFFDYVFYFYFGLFLAIISIFLFVIFMAILSSGSLRFLLLFLFSLGLGVIWCSFFYFDYNDSALQKMVGGRADLSGIVVDEADERENFSRIVFETHEGEKVLLTVHRYPIFNYGDEIKIGGELMKPKKFDSFDWPAYLAKDEIYFEMFYPNVEFIAHGRGNWLKSRLFELRESLTSNISKVIPEPQSSLLEGILFGAKRSMPEELSEDFRISGLSHIVVLSGYNMTIVADAVTKSLFFLPSFLGMALAVVGIIFFAIMTGASATIVRAAIMAIMVIIARASGRVYEVSIALFAAAFFMILHNPRVLRFDSSFQLSFLATLALIYLSPIFEKYLKFLPERWNIRQIAASTLSAQAFVFPLLIYKTGLLSTMSLPANILVLAFIPATMFFGFLAAVAGFAFYYISWFFGIVSYFFLVYETKVAEFFAGLPFSSFEISYFPILAAIILYAFYAVFIFKVKQNDKITLG